MNNSLADCIKTLASLDGQPWWTAGAAAGILEQINQDPLALTLRQTAICIPRQGQTEYRKQLATIATACQQIIRKKQLPAVELALQGQPLRNITLAELLKTLEKIGANHAGRF